MSRRAFEPDIPKLLTIWQSSLPSQIATYGAENVNVNRTAADFERAMQQEEYWLLDSGQGYWAASPSMVPRGLDAHESAGQPGWWGKEAPVVAGLKDAEYRRLFGEVALGWRDRGRALGLQWGWTIGPDTLPSATRQIMVQKRLWQTRLSNGWTLYIYDLGTM